MDLRLSSTKSSCVFLIYLIDALTLQMQALNAMT
jgi:hypothetical protein